MNKLGLAIIVLCSSLIISCRNREDENSSSVKIVNGKPISSEIPGFHSTVSMITLEPGSTSKYIHFCTGVHINQDTVLTSANCLDRVPKTFAKYGDDSNYQNIRGMKSSYSHPLFSGNYYFDMSWFKTKTKANIAADSFLPILTDVEILKNPSNITKAIVLGSGVSSEETAGQRFYAEVDVKSFVNNELGRSMIRAATKDSSVCFGDNGGPLYVQSGGKWYLAGILHGYDSNDKFDHAKPYVDTNENFPSNIELCKQKAELIFTYAGYHEKWIKASVASSAPQNLSINFKNSEKYGSDFIGWCNAEGKSDLAWVSVRLLLDQLLANTCEQAKQKLSTKGFELAVELGALAKAHPLIIQSLLTLASKSVTKLTIRQLYNDQHKIADFLKSVKKFANLEQLRIENYIGYSSLDFLDSVPKKTMEQLNTFHYLPAITPDYDNDGSGRRKPGELKNVSRMLNLKELYLAYNGIDNLEFLVTLKKLESLNLDFNNVKKYESILTMSSLKSLSMVANPLNSDEFKVKLQEKLPSLSFQVGNAQ